MRRMLILAETLLPSSSTLAPIVATHLGTFNGQVGVVNLGGDNYYNANGGAPGDATPSITIEGSNAASILGNGYSPSPGALADGMFRAQNSYQTGLTIKDVNINTTGSPELFGSMTSQGFKVSLINDTIKLGTAASPSYFYYENNQIPGPGIGGPLTGGGFTFTNSTIQLGYASNTLGEVWQNWNGGRAQSPIFSTEPIPAQSRTPTAMW